MLLPDVRCGQSQGAFTNQMISVINLVCASSDFSHSINSSSKKRIVALKYVKNIIMKKSCADARGAVMVTLGSSISSHNQTHPSTLTCQLNQSGGVLKIQIEATKILMIPANAQHRLLFQEAGLKKLSYNLNARLPNSVCRFSIMC